MEWVLKRSIWREDNWYVSHCEDLEIASQGKRLTRREHTWKRPSNCSLKSPHSPRA